MLIGIYEHEVLGTYNTVLDFPRHSMVLTLKLKKNNKYRIDRSATTIHPAIKEIGIFDIKNDSLILYPKYYQTRKHVVNQHKKEKYKCIDMRDHRPCDISILLIQRKDSGVIHLIDKKIGVEWNVAED